jgi:glycosyltransferase involved in cell wall biosynthesis
MRVLLIGNYIADRQQSMIRYANLVLAALVQRGIEAQLMTPPIVVNRTHLPPEGLGRFVNYVDKMGIAPGLIRRHARWADVVHVCDHSNAYYVPERKAQPWVVTCHDMLAVRGSLGEATDCPATPMGRRLQQMILRGLGRANLIVPVSHYTGQDLHRILGPARAIRVIPNALNYPYEPLPAEATAARLGRWPDLATTPFILHVGSNQARKNRETLIDAFALLQADWPGDLALAGPPLTPALNARIARHGLGDRVRVLEHPTNQELHALYCAATVFAFPSRFEGFGWPIAEAQACGCPVVTSDAEPMREVAGGAARLADPNDAEALAAALFGLLQDPAERARLVARGLENARRFAPATMAERLVEAYTAALGA